MGKLFVIFVVTFGVAIAYVVKMTFFWEPPPMPVLERQNWSLREEEDNTIRPFKITSDPKNLKKLRDRLSDAPFVPPLKDSNFEYGFNGTHLREIVAYWKNSYNWTSRLSILNSVPHFKTRIFGLDVHFIRLRPKSPKGKAVVVPLLLLHGWPGSVKEFYAAFPHLAEPGDDFVFDIVVPSLPGYGFSEGAAIPGLGAAQMAQIMRELMLRLGFATYYLQGGDWGSVIASHMATLYPDEVLGVHMNLCGAPLQNPLTMAKLIIGSYWPSLVMEDTRLAHKLYPLSKFFQNILEEFGYLHLQATKPDTIGAALMDSPVGLAAYILEKFSTWVNADWKKLPDGGLTLQLEGTGRFYNIDDLLDNVMIYWTTQSITTSMRLYAETANKKQMALFLSEIPTNVPTVCANYPNELAYYPESMLRDKYRNLLYASYMPRGGHFAAFEEPELFAADVRKAIGAIMEFRLKNIPSK